MEIKTGIIGFLLLCLHGFVSAQTEKGREIRFAGIVFDGNTELSLENVTCKAGHSATTTDKSGRFSINTYIGDTIHFTSVGYKGYNMVVPDTLPHQEYIMAVALRPDTLILAEVVVIHRYGQKERMMRRTASNYMYSALRGAATPQWEMSQLDNQKRILDEYAASTNHGHVRVGFGIGLNSFDALAQIGRNHKRLDQPPELLNVEEMGLVKELLMRK
ncbi:hypothetical protein FACS1894199_06380 [Bacteroidia bacterium]|nr:hypothetical protein FACS1894199_06380 [Bacteroidia bacterium]